jgi:hypothetical protein
MTHRNIGSTLVGIGACAPLVLAAACAGMLPPVQSSGPSVSQEGVQLAVATQQCTQNRDTDNPDDYLAEETVDVQVRNEAPAPITIYPDEFRLLTPDGFALKTATWGAAAPLSLSRGETRTFRLSFMAHGSLQCTRELKLDAAAGVRLADRPVKLTAVRFVPSPTSPAAWKG